MDKNEINLLVEQIRYIAIGKPIPDELKCVSEELLELQSGFDYLSNSLLESNAFLNKLTVGNLNSDVPKNFSSITSTLKDLHSKLRHLTWQANQVAHGNYSQKVSFLGEFSDSFNEMVLQLSQREDKLKKQSINLSQSIDLLKSVMDAIGDFILVTSAQSGDIIYMNKSAKDTFFGVDNLNEKGEICPLITHLQTYIIDENETFSDSIFYEYICDKTNTTLYTTSFHIYWNEQRAYVHYIKDVTDEKEYEQEMQKMIYNDQLTDVLNRRFCVEKIQTLLKENKSFTCCLIDLDGLKYANDTFGHKSGDEYLKTVVLKLKENFGKNDFICRIGGDEFFIISCCKNTDELLMNVKKSDEEIQMKSNKYPMSISYGVIDIEKDTTIDYKTILSETDKKMYILKNKRKKNQKSC